MVILGLDPGSRHTGYGFVRRQGDALTALAFGRISCKSGQALPARLGRLAGELTSLVDRWQPVTAAIETPFHGINSRSLIVLAQARGALLAVLAGRGMRIREYSPAEVKSAVSGSGRADKEQVSRMVRLILGLRDESLSADAADALAVAICCASRSTLEQLTEGG